MRVRLLGHYVHLSIAAMAAADAAVVVGGLLLADRTRFHTWYPVPSIGSDKALWICAAVFTGMNLVSVLGFGLYSSRQRARTGGVFVRLIAACAAATAATALLFYFIPSLYIGRGVLGLALLFSLLGVGAAHGVFSRMMDESLLKRRVLVYGVGQRTTAISGLRRRSDRRGFEIVGYVQPDGEGVAVPADRVLDASGGILQLCTQLEVHEIVVAMEDRRRGFPILGLLECRLAGMEVTELLTFLERETGRVRIDVLNPSWMIFGEGFRRDPVRLFSSRSLDLVASVLLLILSLPFMLITIAAIKLEDGWRAPVFYGQARVGLAGQPFAGAEVPGACVPMPSATARRNGRAEVRPTRHARRRRPIRKLRIDELPQILNVVTGQMSFVGPRPERPQFVAELAQKIPYYVQRHCVKPGITGWAQLCYPYGSSEEDALEKLQYDLYYIKNNTLLFDLAILVQTAEVVFMGKGAR